MKLEAVLFDFDMTLIDTSIALLTNINRIAEHFGLPAVSRQKLMDSIGFNTQDFWTALLGADRPEYRDYYFRKCVPGEADLMAPAAGAVECIKGLQSHGVKVGCASNRIGPMRVIRAKGLEPLMGCVVGADDVALPKPAPNILLEGARRLNAAPQNCLYVGDTPIDIAAATAAGMPCAAVATSNAPETLERAGAWRVLPNLSALVPALEAAGML